MKIQGTLMLNLVDIIDVAEYLAYAESMFTENLPTQWPEVSFHVKVS